MCGPDGPSAWFQADLLPATRRCVLRVEQSEREDATDRGWPLIPLPLYMGLDQATRLADDLNDRLSLRAYREAG